MPASCAAPEPGDHTRPVAPAQARGMASDAATGIMPLPFLVVRRSMMSDDPRASRPQAERAHSASPQTALSDAFADYAVRWPDEADVVEAFRALLAEVDRPETADPFARARLAGHFTASAWLVDRAGMRLLMTHHRKLDRWLQLGGHADGDRDLAAVALKEAEEESGLRDLIVEPTLFDLDRHLIPERGDVPGHWHYDARYVVRATGDESFAISDESHDLAWREIAALLDDPNLDPSIARMARKWVSERD